MQERKEYVYTRKQQSEFVKLGEILDQDQLIEAKEQARRKTRKCAVDKLTGRL